MIFNLKTEKQQKLQAQSDLLSSCEQKKANTAAEQDEDQEENQDEDQEYKEAMTFLEERTRFGINLGLQRIEKLLENLGNPHKQGIKYIHVGGSNGKGSTVVMLANILEAAGLKVGVFTSPHLHSYTERFVINGEEISKADIISLINRIKPVLSKVEKEGIEPPTEFEVTTAMALLYFTEKQVDYAIIEVGMGGEIDSTNVIQPLVAVITNVEMDHMAYLGNTPKEIARVKSGIIKENMLAITGSKNQEVLEVLRKKAADKGVTLLEETKDFTWANRQIIDYNQQFTYQISYQGMQRIIPDLNIKLIGQHQLDNACLAITCSLKLDIAEAAIKAGLLKTFWMGRLEVVSKNPIIVIDGAHNHHGMRALARAVKEYWGNKRIIAVMGMLADKEREKAMTEILPLVDTAIITKVPNARAGNWQMLGEVCDKFRVTHYEIEDVAVACAFARELLEKSKYKEDTIILTTGSLYMIADARAYYLKND